jgi:hypothetical protein
MYGPAGEKEIPHHHSTGCCPARPLRNDNVSMVTHTKGGDGARNAGPKKWGWREAMAISRAEVEVRLVRVERASRGSGFGVCYQFNSDRYL